MKKRWLCGIVAGLVLTGCRSMEKGDVKIFGLPVDKPAPKYVTDKCFYQEPGKQQYLPVFSLRFP